MTEDIKDSKFNIEADDVTIEKTAEWEVLAPAEGDDAADNAESPAEDTVEVAAEDATEVACEAADAGGEAGTEADAGATKSVGRDIVKTRATGLIEDTKPAFGMPNQPDWSDDEKSLGLSGNGEQSMPKPGPSPEDIEIIEKIKKRKLENVARAKRFKIRLKVGIIAGVIIAALLILSVTSIFVVDSIEVKGNSHFTGEEIINIGHASAGRNIFYSSGRKEVIENLEDNPYIKSADVKRKLPSTLVIEVEERQEACALKYDDDYLVVDEEGILLRKSNTVPKLTKVEGMVVSKIKLGDRLGTKDSSLFNSSLDLITSMRKADMYFVRIDVSDEKEVKAYIYETLVVKTDYKTLKKNLDNGRLHKVVEKLFAEGTKRGTITFNGDDSASFKPGL